MHPKVLWIYTSLGYTSILQFEHRCNSQKAFWVTSPSISRLQNEQTRQASLTESGSQHNAGTTRDQRFTSVSINSRARQTLPASPETDATWHKYWNTGWLSDESESHRPVVGLLNRAKESKGEAYMYQVYQDLCSIQSFFFFCGRTFTFLSIKALWRCC